MSFELITHPCDTYTKSKEKTNEEISATCKKELADLKREINYETLLNFAKNDPNKIVHNYKYLFFGALPSHAISPEEKKSILSELIRYHPVYYIEWNAGDKIDVYQEVLDTLSEEALLQNSEIMGNPLLIFNNFRKIENFSWGKAFIQKIIEKYPEHTSYYIGYLRSLRYGLDYMRFIGEKYPNALFTDIDRYYISNDIEMKKIIEKTLLSNPKPDIILRKTEFLIQNGFQEVIKTYLNSQKNLIDFVENYGYGLKVSIDLWKGEPWAKDIIIGLNTRNNNPNPDNYNNTIFSSEWAEEYISTYIKKDFSNSIYLLNYYKDKPWAKKILMNTVEKSPRYGIYQYKDYKDLPYGNEILEKSLESDPIMGLMFLYETREGNNLLSQYLPKILTLIQSRGNEDIENNPENKCLQMTRILNILHEEKPEIRFAILKNIKPENLYRLIVYGRSEVFTSTYNGIIGKIELSNMKIHDILKNVGYKGIHVFFEAVSSYGDLSKILKNTPINELEKIFDALFSQEFGKNKMGNSIAMIEIITNIQDPILLQNIQKRIQEKIINGEDNEEWKIIGKYFSDKKKEFMIPVFSNLDKKYELPNLSSIRSSEMFEEKIDPVTNEMKKINIQQYYFYNDKDGIDSYNHFLEISKAVKWSIEDKSTYIILTKSGKNGTIKIYANKPGSENEGIEELKKINIKPSIVVHRGHSYHARSTIEEIHDNPKMIFLGSCGGFQNIGRVLSKSQNAHIISTKGVGTMLVNDPLFENINSSLLLKDTISWEEIWNNIKPKLKNNENFEKYMRPDKNIGTLFYQRVQSLKTENPH